MRYIVVGHGEDRYLSDRTRSCPRLFRRAHRATRGRNRGNRGSPFCREFRPSTDAELTKSLGIRGHIGQYNKRLLAETRTREYSAAVSAQRGVMIRSIIGSFARFRNIVTRVHERPRLLERSGGSSPATSFLTPIAAKTIAKSSPPAACSPDCTICTASSLWLHAGAGEDRELLSL